jgi:multisubunit Na+/H+ antiporter MnhG subunit
MLCMVFYCKQKNNMVIGLLSRPDLYSFWLGQGVTRVVCLVLYCLGVFVCLGVYMSMVD